MTDDALILWKVGDKEFGLKDGMPIEPLPLDDPAYENYVPSPHTKKVFVITRVRKSFLDARPNLFKGQTKDDNIKDKSYRIRPDLITLSDLESYLSMPGLESSLRNGSQVEILDCTGPGFTAILKKSTKLNEAALDRNAVSAGEYTVGTGVGDHYPSWTAAYADIANLTANLTFNQTSNLLLAATATITETLGAFTFTCTSSNPHWGDPTAGWTTRVNGNIAMFDIRCGGPGTVEIEHLYYIQQSAAAASTVIVFTGIAGLITANMHDLLFDGADQNAGGAIVPFDNGVTVSVYNVVIWGFSLVGGRGIWVLNMTISEFNNVTIYNCAIGVENDSYANRYTSCAFFGCGANFANNANSASDNCGTDKAAFGAFTDNNPQINLVLADEFVSSDSAESNFMRCAVGGSLATNGTDPTIAANVLGIRGNARPHSPGVISIGADEFAALPSDASVSENNMSISIQMGVQ